MNAIISNKAKVIQGFTSQPSPSLNQSFGGQKLVAKKNLSNNDRQDLCDDENLYNESLMREMLYFDRF